MSTLQSTPTFDVEALRHGIEDRDAATMRGLYAENAQVKIVDQRDRPSSPLEITGSAAIGEFLDELCGREMEHHLEEVLVSPDGEQAAYLERCRYPDGTTVLSSSTLNLRDGRIIEQTSLQAWDEASAGGGAKAAAAPTAAEHLDFGHPDEVRTFGHGRLEILKVGGGAVGRLTVEPGWRWSQDVKPLVGTEWCEAPHFQYQVSGTVRVHMADGTEFDSKAGDVTVLPSGHDAWVIGDEPAVFIDWQGASHYAEKSD